MPPDRGRFSSHDVFVDSEVCAPEGFSVNVIVDENNAFQGHFDRSGDEAFLAVHVSCRVVISANGRTIVERDRLPDTFYPDGSSRRVGPTVHVQGPHGIVQRDAGQLCSVPMGRSWRSTVRTPVRGSIVVLCPGFGARRAGRQLRSEG